MRNLSGGFEKKQALIWIHAIDASSEPLLGKNCVIIGWVFCSERDLESAFARRVAMTGTHATTGASDEWNNLRAEACGSVAVFGRQRSQQDEQEMKLASTIQRSPVWLLVKLALIRRQFAATGGAELYLQRLVPALSGKGHEIHLFAEQWSGSPEGVVMHRVTVDASRSQRGPAFAQAVDVALRSHVFDCVFSLERTLRQDVYRAGDGVHRVWLERRRQFAPWWKRPFIGWSAFHRNMQALEAQVFQPANTGRIIVNSEMVKREILNHFDYPSDRIHLVRNGVDVDRLQRGSREETRRRFGFKDQDLVLLFVGSGWERKGLRYLMKAMDYLGLHPRMEPAERESVEDEERSQRRGALSVKLLIVGKGRSPYLTSDDYIFAGAMSDVENAYAAADLFVFPPIYEPSANVVAEAMAAGLPVITTAQNGASEWIEEGVDGTVLPDPSDIRAIARAILHWASRRFVARPLDTERFRLERNVSETLAVLELAASEKRARKANA